MTLTDQLASPIRPQSRNNPLAREPAQVLTTTVQPAARPEPVFQYQVTDNSGTTAATTPLAADDQAWHGRRFVGAISP